MSMTSSAMLPKNNKNVFHARLKDLGGNTMKRNILFGVTVVAAAILFSQGSETLAQQPSSGDRISMFCKTSAGGPGFVLVTLSNLTTSTIPKGKTLFAKKGDKTIKFRAAEAILAGGSASYRTNASAFQVEGPCDGWY